MTSQTSAVADDEWSDATGPGRSNSGTDTTRWKRTAPTIAGIALIAYGLTRRSVRGVAAAIAGGYLVYRGLGGGGSPGGGTSVSTGEQPTVGTPPDALDVERSVTVEQPADELYDRWRDPETHEQMWAHFAEVSQTGEDEQHWAVTGPAGVSIEWDAAVVEDEPGEYLHWESLPGATVPNEGWVYFEPRANEEETEVRLRLQFDPPGGTFGTTAIERLDMVPAAAAGTVLRRFKSLAETGEIPTLEGNPSARGSGDLL